MRSVELKLSAFANDAAIVAKLRLEGLFEYQNTLKYEILKAEAELEYQKLKAQNPDTPPFVPPTRPDSTWTKDLANFNPKIKKDTLKATVDDNDEVIGWTYEVSP